MCTLQLAILGEPHAWSSWSPESDRRKSAVAEMAATWLEDIRSWPSPRWADDGTSLLAGILTDMPRRFGRIGFELGREHSLRMPVMQFLGCAISCGALSLDNGSPCIWQIRMVKTGEPRSPISSISARSPAGPMRRCRGSCRSATAKGGLPQAAHRAGPARRRIPHRSCRRSPGPGGVSQIVCGPPYDRVLEAGDVLFFDTGSTFDGYWCDFDRNYAVGAISDAARRAHEAMWQATEAGLAAAVPGASCAAVFHAMARIIEAAGSVGNNVGRFGHGLGMQLTRAAIPHAGKWNHYRAGHGPDHRARHRI